MTELELSIDFVTLELELLIDFVTLELVGRHMYMYYTNYWIIVGRLVNKQMYDLVNRLNVHTFTRKTIQEAMKTITVRAELPFSESEEFNIEPGVKLINMIYNVSYNSLRVIERMKEWDVLVVQRLQEKRELEKNQTITRISCQHNDRSILSTMRLEGEKEIKEYTKLKHIRLNEAKSTSIHVLWTTYSQEVLDTNDTQYMLYRQSWMSLKQRLKCIKATTIPINKHSKGIYHSGDEIVCVGWSLMRELKACYSEGIGCLKEVFILLRDSYDMFFQCYAYSTIKEESQQMLIDYVITNSLFHELDVFIDDNFSEKDKKSTLLLLAVASEIENTIQRNAIETMT